MLKFLTSPWRLLKGFVLVVWDLSKSFVDLSVHKPGPDPRPVAKVKVGQRIWVDTETYKGYGTVVAPPGFMQVVRYAYDEPRRRVLRRVVWGRKRRVVYQSVTAATNVRVLPYDPSNPLCRVPEAHRRYLGRAPSYSSWPQVDEGQVYERLATTFSGLPCAWWHR